MIDINCPTCYNHIIAAPVFGPCIKHYKFGEPSLDKGRKSCEGNKIVCDPKCSPKHDSEKKEK